MCRLLYINSEKSFNIVEYLQQFALISKSSKEYQGHGWGMAYLVNGKWEYYKNISPIWEDDLTAFGESERIIVHARSAFQDKGIDVKNNMPFFDDEYIFIFNGELNGVKINSEGRIGAEKIFNFIKRINKNNMKTALTKSMDIVIKRTRYLRAMNIIIAGKNSTWVYSLFNEDRDYFTMFKKETGKQLIICSEKLDNSADWQPVSQNNVEEFKCF